MSNTETHAQLRDRWNERLDRVEKALAQANRSALVNAALDPIRCILELEDAGTILDQKDTLAAIGAVMGELKRCIGNPRATPNMLPFEQLRRFAKALGAPTPSSWGAQGESQGAHSEEADLLKSLFGGQESSLSALIEDALKSNSPDAASVASVADGIMSGASTGGRVLMKGELQPGLLCDLIQLLAQNRESGALKVYSDQVKGHIFFSDGEVVDSRAKGEHGEQAFFAIMMARSGKFAYKRSEASETRTIERPTQFLLMDTLRLIDETGDEHMQVTEVS